MTKKYTTPPPQIDIVKFVPELAPLARTTVRLHPHRTKRDSKPDTSKIAGLFLWPEHEPWPMYEEHNAPYVPVVQLRKDDFPEIAFKPGTDLFQLLWTPYREDSTFLPIPKTFWRKASEVKHPLKKIPALEDYGVDTEDIDVSDNVPKMCSVYPERVVEYPDLDELRWANNEVNAPIYEKIVKAKFTFGKKTREEAQSQMSDEDWRHVLYGCYLSVCPGAKVGGGFPRVDENGKTWELLLTIPSWEFDRGSAARWLPLEDRPKEKGEELFNLTVDALLNPMGMDLGRTQRVQIRICRELPDWPIQMDIMG